jgi:hypothetical protein
MGIEDAYKAIANHTKELCDVGCPGVKKDSYRCCDKQWCEAAERFAASDYGIDIGGMKTEYGIGIGIPFMNENHECVVPPHLRPICSTHVCPWRYSNPEWERRYKELKIIVVEEEKKRYGGM